MIDLADARFDDWRAMVGRVEVPMLADRLEMLRPSWMRNGACRGSGTGAYFPERGVSTARAKGVCAACAVRRECLAYALADPDLVGVWGGTSEAERRVMRRRVA
jgi:WhiB family redox-sensing transcriptional regulator